MRYIRALGHGCGLVIRGLIQGAGCHVGVYGGDSVDRLEDTATYGRAAAHGEALNGGLQGFLVRSGWLDQLGVASKGCNTDLRPLLLALDEGEGRRLSCVYAAGVY